MPEDSAMEKLEMEISSDQSKNEQPQAPGRRKGGLITMPFIIANEAFEKVASYGLLPNMILYLMRDYNMGIAKGTNLLFFWSAATNFLPLVGAFLSDSYLGRFLTIGFGSISSLLGMTLLWLTAMLPQARPPPCNQLAHNCKSPTSAQFGLLVSSFALMSIGAGGIRPCSLAFGAEQLDKKENPKNERVLETFFSWYYASAALSVVVALTGIVYIQDHVGWKVGFGVPAVLMFLSAFLFFLASPFYIKHNPSTSLFTGFARVLAVAYKNRKLAFPPSNSDGWYYHDKDSKLVVPTDKLRFLNKACIIRSPEKDIDPDGLASNPWRLCTVEQVEELKALIKVIPLWSTGIMMSINISQSSFPLLQANSMDRHITSNFQIPAGSFGMFTIIALTIWIAIYDRVLLPLASKLRGKPVRLSTKERMGIGLFFSCMAMVVSGLVEHIRRRRAIHEGFLTNPHGLVGMSAMWLVPQHCLSGLAEAFNAIGQTEFYYSEFPKNMSSIASSLFGLGMAVANLLASVILNTVDNATKRGGKESWVSIGPTDLVLNKAQRLGMREEVLSRKKSFLS
ncbi:protein NRT1/ PTR FAMILY 1.2-like isoform X2 [Malania oleifera]|uniref:protein NRT1/ PTR FAMILY 1.2-like isoform X2 n=1 Tax=Malania oleifera TaxID=397392 RepID=UPI0025AE9D21|nr:protein NRT1/ PTR FAMILY 1.2-like isoform X2 [Malania oleifera]